MSIIFDKTQNSFILQAKNSTYIIKDNIAFKFELIDLTITELS